MALGATFWSTSGLAALWNDITGLATGSVSSPGSATGKTTVWLTPVKIYQEPMVLGVNDKRQHDNPGVDSGYFYLLETSTGEITWSDDLFMPGYDIPYSGLNRNQALKYLVPYCKKGDLIPEVTSSPGANGYPKDPMYRTGFVTGPNATYPCILFNSNEVAIELRVFEKVGSWRLWHYSPHAWSGTPPEVIASAMMTAGLDADDIDQTGFDDAHDAYDLSTGDAPWTGLDTKWEIYARREVGTKVSDFMLELVSHCRDLLYVNEAGVLSISSWTRPTNDVTGFTAEGDQVLDVLSHTITMRHTFNSVRASWGMASRQGWEGTAGSTPQEEEIFTSFDPTLNGRPTDKWVDEDSNSTSVARFGQIWLKGKTKIINSTGQPKEVQVTHYPFLLSPHVTTSTSYVWDKSTDGGGMLHATNWLTSDGKTRAEIEIRQGAMCFDTGIGDLIEDLEITGDGRTIGEARIIERTYDFDNLTADSLIMEIPSNT